MTEKEKERKKGGKKDRDELVHSDFASAAVPADLQEKKGGG